MNVQSIMKVSNNLYSNIDLAVPVSDVVRTVDAAFPRLLIIALPASSSPMTLNSLVSVIPRFTRAAAKFRPTPPQLRRLSPL